jgi:hypothetical protein
MKISIKPMKPRNPHAVAAKMRNAGAHGTYRAERKERRVEKQALRALVIGQNRKGEEHA